MKILGWMHRKFRGNEPLRDFSIGNPCSCLSRQASLDDLQYYPNPNSASKPLGKPLREFNLRNSFAGLESKGFEEDDFEDDLSAANSELFHGFLTIGTFGSDPVVADPTATPTFSISVENIAEKETEVTEDDLKLINNELEKVLGNEEEESPGRKSHVSTRRSSHASTITLSGNLWDGTDANGNGTMTCPLQGYLFGSAIDLTETTRARKERASLGELFQKTNIEEEKCDDKTDGGAKRKDKGNDHISAIRIIMKNMLKKKTGHASSQNSSPVTEKNVDSASTNTKLQKILRIFHRKIYPEGSMASRKSDKPPKNEMKNKTKHQKRYRNVDHTFTEDDTIIYPPKSQNCFNLSQATVSARDFIGNKECWIKTDSDYLVLEL